MLLSLGSLLILIPWLSYNALHYSNLLWDLFEQWKIVAEYTRPMPASVQLWNLCKILGPLILFLPLGIYSFLKDGKEKYTDLIIISTIISLIYISFFVNVKFARYHYVNLFFYYLLAFQGMLWAIKKYPKLTKLLIIISITWIILSLTYVLNQNYKEGKCDKEGVVYQTIKYVDKNITKENLIISNYWPWIGYYNNRRVGSMWNTNVSDIIKNYSPFYIIYSPQLGDEYDKQELDKALVLKKEIKDNCNKQAFIYSSI